jgi:DNA polymerase I-like protein with 3'-5' exonuclease and polymerase domains
MNKDKPPFNPDVWKIKKKSRHRGRPFNSGRTNSQNIPIRTEEGSKIRAALTVATEQQDFSGIESRILAAMSGQSNNKTGE